MNNINKRNYQKELEELIKKIEKDSIKPQLLLHVCCAPCSSYVLEYLQKHFEITVLFYNPNITNHEEYEKRKEELKRFLNTYPFQNKIKWLECEYKPEEYCDKIIGMENEPERGERCSVCYGLRLEKTAQFAKKVGADYFCTTLSISPHKDAERLMILGEGFGHEYDVKYLPSDFKKKNGYRRSIELSEEYGLYRQDYCGCIYSKRSR